MSLFFASVGTSISTIVVACIVLLSLFVMVALIFEYIRVQHQRITMLRKLGCTQIRQKLLRKNISIFFHISTTLLLTGFFLTLYSILFIA